MAKESYKSFWSRVIDSTSPHPSAETKYSLSLSLSLYITHSESPLTPSLTALSAKVQLLNWSFFYLSFSLLFRSLKQQKTAKINAVFGWNTKQCSFSLEPRFSVAVQWWPTPLIMHICAYYLLHSYTHLVVKMTVQE